MISLAHLIEKLERMALNPHGEETFHVGQAVHSLAVEIKEMRQELDFIFRHLIKLDAGNADNGIPCSLIFEDGANDE